MTEDRTRRAGRPALKDHDKCSQSTSSNVAPLGWRDGAPTRWYQWPERLFVKIWRLVFASKAEMDWLETHDPDEFDSLSIW